MPVVDSARSTAVPAAPARRIVALDITKGALVVFMVIYHALNYSDYRTLAFQLLAFLPPSFILLTGYLVGSIYLLKYKSGSAQVTRRLMVRGLKLLLIFIVLNIGVDFMLIDRSGTGLVMPLVIREASVIFLAGNHRMARFEVLLPIAYLLMFAPVLLWLQATWRWGVSVLVCGLMIACAILEASGHLTINLDFLSVGVLGVALGRIPRSSIDACARHGLVVAGLYVGYRVARFAVGEIYLIQALGCVASVFVLYALARVSPAGWLTNQLELLGQYSLLAYILQIAVLQIIGRLAARGGGGWLGLSFIFAITLVLTWALVVGMRSLKSRSRLMDRAYGFAFG
jgi:hypothetical protein